MKSWFWLRFRFRSWLVCGIGFRQFLNWGYSFCGGEFSYQWWGCLCRWSWVVWSFWFKWVQSPVFASWISFRRSPLWESGIPIKATLLPLYYFQVHGRVFLVILIVWEVNFRVIFWRYGFTVFIGKEKYFVVYRYGWSLSVVGGSSYTLDKPD